MLPIDLGSLGRSLMPIFDPQISMKKLKMRILLIIPGINKTYNDNAYSYIYIHKLGADISVISNRLRITKGIGIETPYECMDGIYVHRIYNNFKEQTSFPIRQYHRVHRIVEEFQPDLIFCSQQKNMRLAVKLKKHFKIPIILLVEFAYNTKNPFRLIGKKKLLRFNIFGRVFAKMYWKWLCRNSSAIITCYHGDKSNFEKLSINNTPIYYVPWPAYPTSDPSSIKKVKGRGIYIGALAHHKNIPEFDSTLPKLFDSTPTEEFYIVGSGEYQYTVNALEKLYANRIRHIPSLPREKALELIASSYYAYTPVEYGGWGFIGDCWSMKTPIIATHNDYDLKNNSDSLITSTEKIVDTINELYDNNQLYEKIQNGGYERFRKYHNAETVGKKYIEIMESVLNKKI